MSSVGSLLPNLNSPKLPQPIFLPTLKLGPTMSTALLELEDVREAPEALFLLLTRPPSLSSLLLCLSDDIMAGWRICHEKTHSHDDISLCQSCVTLFIMCE